MNITEILARCDHTLLLQTATWDEIRAICDDGMKYHTASVCIPPCYVKKAKEYGATATEYLSAVLLYCFYEQQKKEKEMQQRAAIQSSKNENIQAREKENKVVQ